MITCKFEWGKEVSLRHTVVHCLVLRDNKILLVKRSEKIIEGGKWGFPSGFIDRDETAEKAAIRELMEETGWNGEIEKLFRINSDPQRRNDEKRQNIALEFLVKPIDKTGESDWEQTAVKWFEINEIDPDTLAFDHGKTLMHLRKYLKEQVEIPIIE